MEFDRNNPVKLRLLVTVPVDPKYGLIRGREIVAFVDQEHGREARAYPRWWYVTNPEHWEQDPVGILSREAEVIE